MTLINIEFPQCALTLRDGKIVGAPLDGSDSQRWILVLRDKPGITSRGYLWNGGIYLGWDEDNSTVIPSTLTYFWELIMNPVENEVGFRIPDVPEKTWHHALATGGDGTEIYLENQRGGLTGAQLWKVTFQ